MSEDWSEDLEAESLVDIAVVHALTARTTIKAFGDPAAPRPPQGLSKELVGDLVALAGNAPFHYPAHPEVRGDGPIEPWRVHMFDGPACRAFLQALDPADNPGKISDMLAIAEALLCVTWLPDPPEGGDRPEMTDRNIEHIAATSAFIQSLLTAATATGTPSYWSSGGLLRTRKYLDMLAAGPHEQLLGAIFLFPKDLSDAPTKLGNLRAQRSPASAWARWLEP